MIRLPEFARNVTTLSVGSVAASVISLASVPIISRLFTPDDFGAAALYLSIVTVLATAATLRYDHAVIIPDERSEAVEIALLSLCVLGVFLLIVTGFAATAFLVVPDFAWIKILGWWFLLIPIGVCLLSISNVAVNLNTRLKNYRDIALAESSQAGMVSISRIVLGTVQGPTITGLISGLLLGYAARALILMRKLRHQVLDHIQDISLLRLKVLSKKYGQFPRYSMPTGLLRSLGENMPIFFLAYMFLPSTVGSYAMATRLMRFPIALFGESVRRTYLQKAAELNNKHVALAPSLTKITVALAGIGILIFLPLLVWGSEIFAFVLGERWAEAGSYISILTPWFFFTLVQMSSSLMYIVFQKQDQLFRIHVISTLAILLAFAFVLRFDANPEITLISLSSVGAVVNILILGKGFSLARSHSLD
jgi:O-antigen/teichoic acid export membrane protein